MSDWKETEQRMKALIEGLSPDDVGSLLYVIGNLDYVSIGGWWMRKDADLQAEDRWGRSLTDEEWRDFAACISDDDDEYYDRVGNWFADNEPEEVRTEEGDV